jgi:hypothetical protein
MAYNKRWLNRETFGCVANGAGSPARSLLRRVSAQHVALDARSITIEKTIMTPLPFMRNRP